MRRRAFQEERRARIMGRAHSVLGTASQGSSLVEMVAANEVGRELDQGLGCQAREVTSLLRAVGATEGHFPRKMTWLDL